MVAVSQGRRKRWVFDGAKLAGTDHMPVRERIRDYVYRVIRLIAGG
jgi:hypothetical protein